MEYGIEGGARPRVGAPRSGIRQGTLYGIKRRIVHMGVCWVRLGRIIARIRRLIVLGLRNPLNEIATDRNGTVSKLLSWEFLRIRTSLCSTIERNFLF
jgi:hypothetical protein